MGEEGRERLQVAAGAELPALVGESYKRAYGMMVQLQQLAELEEMATGGELGRLRNFQNHYGD